MRGIASSRCRHSATPAFLLQATGNLAGFAKRRQEGWGMGNPNGIFGACPLRLTAAEVRQGSASGRVPWRRGGNGPTPERPLSSPFAAIWRR